MVEYPPVEFWEAKTITVAATAGNVVTNKSPTTGYRWILLGFRLSLTTDATVATRSIKPTLTDGTNTYRSLHRSADRAASGTTVLTGGTEDRGTQAQEAAHCQFGLVILQGSDQFKITITNGVAGDSYSGFLRVLQIRL